jgi:electron transfer DM13
MDIRFRLFLITGMALLVGVVWTLPQWWIIVNPESVLAEEMQGLERSVQEQFVMLPDIEKVAYLTIFNGDEELEIESEPDWALALVRERFLGQDVAAEEAIEPFELPVGSLVIATGEFVSIDIIREAEGEITIYQLANGSRILRFSENFRSIRAPDIRIILTRNPDPMDERGVSIDYLEISVLRGNVGAQNYTVPEVADFSRYPVMALYSPEYDALIATLTIR